MNEENVVDTGNVAGKKKVDWKKVRASTGAKAKVALAQSKKAGVGFLSVLKAGYDKVVEWWTGLDPRQRSETIKMSATATVAVVLYAFTGLLWTILAIVAASVTWGVYLCRPRGVETTVDTTGDVVVEAAAKTAADASPTTRDDGHGENVGGDGLTCVPTAEAAPVVPDTGMVFEDGDDADEETQPPTDIPDHRI